MLEVIGFTKKTVQSTSFAVPVARRVHDTRLGLLCCGIVLLTCGHAREGFAASQLNMKMVPVYRATPVGQQQTGLPLKLHGVFEGFDPQTRTLKLTHLALLESFWEEAMGDVEVDSSVDTNAIAPGTAVTATLKRGANGRYHVTGLARG